MTAQYFRFTPDVKIISTDLAPHSRVPSGVVFPQWYANNALEYVPGTGLVQTPVSGIAAGASTSGTVINILTVPNILVVPNILGSPAHVGTVGYISASGDGAGGAFLLQHGGFLVDYTVSGAVTPYQENSNAIFKGLAVSGTTPWMVSASGNVFTVLGSNIVMSGSFGHLPAYGLDRIGSTLYTVLAASSGIGSYNLATGASGLITTPMNVPAILATSGNLVAVGGWSTGQMLNAASGVSGFCSMETDPVLPAILIGANSDNSTTSIWNQDSVGNWTIGVAVTGVAAQNIVWNPNATQLLACNPTTNQVFAFTYILGALSLQATFAVSGASLVDFSGNGNEALVVSPGVNLLTSFVPSGSGWTVSGTLSATTPSSVTSFSADAVLVGHSSGVTQYNFGGGHWTPGSYLSLPFTVKSIALDPSSGIVAAGTSGTNGFLAYSGSTISFSGTGDVVLNRNSQFLVLDRTNSLVRIFGITNGVLSAQGSVSVSTLSGAVTGMSAGPQSAGTIFVYSRAQTLLYHLGGPYQMIPVVSGVVSIYNTTTSGFSSARLNIGQQPEALAWDPSGNVAVVTLQNTMYTINTSGVVVSSGAIQQFSGQPQTTPIGISNLLWVGNALYATSILNDSFVQVQ